MAVATFDTLKFANTLKASGVPDKQAEAQATAFAEVIQLNLKDLATKDDLASAVKDLRQEIKDVRQEIKDVRQEIKDVEYRLNARIDVLSARMDTLVAQLRGEMLLLKWMFGVGVAAAVGILIRLFVYRGPL